MSKTSIEWTSTTWNPVRGCSRVSAGCDNCYAMGQAHRFSGPGKPYEGLTTIRRGKVDWTGHARLVPGQLEQPLRWKKPRRIFVNSMSDLFHESLSFEEIAAVFGVMAACPQHTFQVLTKRPKRALEFFGWADTHGNGFDLCRFGPSSLLSCAWAFSESSETEGLPTKERFGYKWPLPNVHLGVSAENQEQAESRIPLLLQCPAAVRWVSAEPLLGPIDFGRIQWETCGDCDPCIAGAYEQCPVRYPLATLHCGEDGIRWIIVGGESGPGARPCDVEWIRSIVRQCRAAGVPCFTKQLGSKPVARDRYDMSDEQFRLNDAAGWDESDGPIVLRLKNKKGADPTEWPEDLRVRQFPEVSR